MDVNRDEVRRQLIESQREHAASIPRFREMLKRLFDHDSDVSAEAKAELLGVPSRRSFLTLGGVTVAGSAVLVGCASPKKNQLPVTGTTEAPPSSTTTTAPGSAETDLTLLRTAQSIEVLAISAYADALKSGLLTTPAIVDAITLFKNQHSDHANLLASTIRTIGGTPFDTANNYLDVTIVQPGLAAAKTELEVVALATTLEDTAAQTYTLAGGVLTTSQLRAAAMSIGATEARHLTLLLGVQNLNPVPLAFMPTRKSTPEESYIGTDGKTKKEPVPPTTTTTAAKP
jgi:hypothetical protein